MPNVSVYNGAQNATHDISLSDGTETYGLMLSDGAQSIHETPQGGSANPFNVKQSTLVGGRGNAFFSQDQTRFFDNQALWTGIDQSIMPSPQFRFASGIVAADESLPGSVTWKSLIGAQRYAATSFVAGSSPGYSGNQSSTKANLWVKRIGSPGTLTAELWSNSGGSPNAVLKTATVTTSTITDTISVFQKFTWASAQTLTNGTTYWIVIYGASTDNDADHWEVGCDTTGTSKVSTAGGVWASSSPAFGLYYRVSATPTAARFYFFEYYGAQMAVTNPDSGTGKLYVNGDLRRVASATSTTATVSSNGISWGTNQWAGAYARITSGQGRGQVRLISSNTSGTTGVLTLSSAWNVNPAAGSVISIFATGIWNEITGTGFGGTMNKPAVLNNIVYVPQGSGASYIRRMQLNTTTGAFDFADDGTNKAVWLYTFRGSIYRAQSAKLVSKAPEPTGWGTNLTFGSTITIGSGDSNITGMTDFNGSLYVWKPSEMYVITNDVPTQVNVGIGSMPDDNNGAACKAHMNFLMFSWAHSVESYYGSSMNDIGFWKHEGMPAARNGQCGGLESVLNWLLASCDAGDSGVSSLMVWNGYGWAEWVRGYDTGARMRNIRFQPSYENRGRLWMEIGNEIAYFEMPQNTLNPLRDTGFKFQHESVLITSTLDMNNVTASKIFKDVSLQTQNLGSSAYVGVDYQVDTDIGTDNWTQLGNIAYSPAASLDVNRGNVKLIRFRFRLNTNTNTTAPVITAWGATGYLREPTKYQWNLSVKIASGQGTRIGAVDFKPEDVLTYLQNSAKNMKPLFLKSVFTGLDDKWVYVEPPSLLRTFQNNLQKQWGGRVIITLREM